MKIAIIHYWLLKMRGGEKVLENICDLYPDADIFTHVYNPICISDKINSHNVYTTFINRLPFVKKYYQYYLPLMPIALKKINLNKYDLIISCESGPSKGINKYNAKHICYCHTPMRYLWDMHDIYYENYNVIAKLGMKIFIKYLRKWDLESSFNIDRIITNSKFVSNRIAKYWNKESFVVYPGIDTSKCKKDNIDNNYYLIISEIVSYKRIDLAIEAFANLNHKLIIIGDGPLLNKYKKKCSSNIEMLGWKEDYEKDIYLSNCSALIFPGIEDFGLVPLEAMVFGKPVIAYNGGGVIEYLKEWENGILFNEHNAESLINCINEFENNKNKFDSGKIIDSIRKYDNNIFKENFKSIINKLMKNNN